MLKLSMMDELHEDYFQFVFRFDWSKCYVNKFIRHIRRKKKSPTKIVFVVTSYRFRINLSMNVIMNVEISTNMVKGILWFNSFSGVYFPDAG